MKKLGGCEKQGIDIPNDEQEEDDEEVEPQKKRVKTESPSSARLDTPQIQLPEIADPAADDSASLQVYAMI